MRRRARAAMRKRAIRKRQIGLHAEKLMPLVRIPAKVRYIIGRRMGGRLPWCHLSTLAGCVAAVEDGVEHGIDSIRLEAVRAGGTYYTSFEAVKRFLSHFENTPCNELPEQSCPTARDAVNARNAERKFAKQQNRTKLKLFALGIALQRGINELQQRQSINA